MSYKDLILVYLIEHGSITSLEAITKFGNTRLAATIHLLKKDLVPIKTETIQVVNRYGKKVNVAKYSVPDDFGKVVNKVE